MHAHAGAESVQIVVAGCTELGSSSVPARRINKWGRDSAALVTGVPQRSQNWRCIRLPLSAKLTKSRKGPVIATAPAGNTTLTVPLPAARNWQSRHQQTRVAMGSAATVYRTAPHRHPPVLVMGYSDHLYSTDTQRMGRLLPQGHSWCLRKSPHRASNTATVSTCSVKGSRSNAVSCVNRRRQDAVNLAVSATSDSRPQLT